MSGDYTDAENCDECGRPFIESEEIVTFEHNDKSVPDHNWCVECAERLQREGGGHKHGK